MELIETTAIADVDLPVADLRAHLRLGTGFADEATGDPLLAQYLRAAMSAIETRTGKALMTRGFKMTLPRWRWADKQALPVAPVSAITAVTMRDATGAPAVVSPGRYRLLADRHRPQICAVGSVLPLVPSNGSVEVEFTAGFGANWDAVPDDLRQAVFLQAARFYEERTGIETGLNAQTEALIARWLPVRLTLGGQV